MMKIRSHSESHLVELDDGSKWQIFPGDIDVTLNWLPDTELKLVRIEDPASSHALISEDNSSVRVSAGRREVAVERSASSFKKQLSGAACSEPVEVREDSVVPSLGRCLPLENWCEPIANNGHNSPDQRTNLPEMLYSGGRVDSRCHHAFQSATQAALPAYPPGVPHAAGLGARNPDRARRGRGMRAPRPSLRPG